MVRIEFQDYDINNTISSKHSSDEAKRDDTDVRDVPSVDVIHSNVLKYVKSFIHQQQQRVRLLHNWENTFRSYMEQYKSSHQQHNNPTLSKTHRHLNNNFIGNSNESSDDTLISGYTSYCENVVTSTMNTINTSMRDILNQLNKSYQQLYHSGPQPGDSLSASKSLVTDEEKNTSQSHQHPPLIQLSDVQSYIDTIRHIQEQEQEHMTHIISYQSIIHQHVILYHNEYSEECSQQIEGVRVKLNDVTSRIAELMNELKYSINGIT